MFKKNIILYKFNFNKNMEKEKINVWEENKRVKKKTQMVVGNQKYVNPNTGEIETFTVIEKNISKDFNWHKIWLQDVLNILDSFGNKKILVITYLLKIMRNEDNTISGTYRDISEKCGVSLPTVSMVMNELISSDIIRKITTATYQFNPSLIMKGSGEKRTNLLVKYRYGEDDNKAINNAKQIDTKTQKILQHNIFGGIDVIDITSEDNDNE